MRPSRACLPVLILALAGCGPAPDPAADARAKAQQDAAAADEIVRQIETALSASNWTLARAQCDVLGFRFPQSEAVKRLATRCADAKAQAAAAAEQARLQGLWIYQSQPVGKKAQVTASIYAKDDIDTGAGTSHVRLIFRDHPDWGRSSYLVLDNGDFDCYGGCTLKLTVDGKPRTLPGRRPKTDEAIAMFVDDARGLWRIARSAKSVTIRVPLKGAPAQDAVFEVGGLDPSKMPRW